MGSHPTQKAAPAHFAVLGIQNHCVRGNPVNLILVQARPACERIDPARRCQGVRAQSHRHIPRSQVYSLSATARSEMWGRLRCVEICSPFVVGCCSSQTFSSKTTNTKTCSRRAFSPQNRTQNPRPKPRELSASLRTYSHWAGFRNGSLELPSSANRR